MLHGHGHDEDYRTNALDFNCCQSDGQSPESSLVESLNELPNYFASEGQASKSNVSDLSH